MMEIEQNCISRIDKRNFSIACFEGSIWITYRNGNDIVLKSGESRSFKNKKDVILQGLVKSKYVVTNF